ncbi:unnamed protein product, partial [Mesorhabditis spiculigera]
MNGEIQRMPSSAQLKEIFGKFNTDDSDGQEAMATTRFLCSKFMGGIWARAPAKAYTVKTVTGGMSNLLYFVELQHPDEKGDQQDIKILMRIQCQGGLDEQLTESVVFTLLSERGLGPQLLGIFPGGRFETFIDSRALTCQEISQPKFARLLAPMVAHIHTLDVPITKEPQALSRTEGWLHELKSLIDDRKIELTTKLAKVDRNRVPDHVTADQLLEEVQFYQKFLDVAGSPIVFSHNDLQEGNFLLVNGYSVTEEGYKDKDGKTANPKDAMVLIDYEYASYNYRGFDLGNHLCEYAFDYSSEEAPYYAIHSERFQDVEGRRAFAQSYVDEIYRLKEASDDTHFPSDLVTGNREKDVEKESTLFMTLSHLFWSAWALVNAENAICQFDYASYGRDRLAIYFDSKHLLEEYIAKHS